jgi:single-strand DNA-binding protein
MINSVVLVGRMGTDPELRYAQTGTPIAKFRLAVSRPRRSDSPEEETDWLNIVCFGKTAEFVGQYLDKGSLVGIEGRIQTRQYDQDGRQMWWTEIAANNVQALESRQEAERRRGQQGGVGGAPRQPQQAQPPRQAPQQRPAQAPQQQSYGPPEPDDFQIDESNDPFGDQ